MEWVNGTVQFYKIFLITELDILEEPLQIYKKNCREISEHYFVKRIITIDREITSISSFLTNHFILLSFVRRPRFPRNSHRMPIIY